MCIYNPITKKPFKIINIDIGFEGIEYSNCKDTQTSVKTMSSSVFDFPVYVSLAII